MEQGMVKIKTRGMCVDPMPSTVRGLRLRKEEAQAGKLPPIPAEGGAASLPRMLCSRLLSLVFPAPLLRRLP